MNTPRDFLTEWNISPVVTPAEEEVEEVADVDPHRARVPDHRHYHHHHHHHRLERGRGRGRDPDRCPWVWAAGMTQPTRPWGLVFGSTWRSLAREIRLAIHYASSVPDRKHGREMHWTWSN